MTSLVLNEETSKITIGEILAAATGSVVEIEDESGNLVARVLVESQGDNDHSLVEPSEAEIDELRRRRRADRSDDVTTEQLLARVQSLSSE
jgi:hypothetical protein